MKGTTVLYVMVAAAAFAGHAEAVYKCTTAKGIVYQDRPCREGNETDLQIVIPTGEVGPKSTAAQDADAQANGAKPERGFGVPKSARTPRDDRASAGNTADKRSDLSYANAGDDTRRKGARAPAENSGVPMTAEQAQRTEPTAKYYTTDAASPGADTPEQMTCESANGEKRRFYLTNGKLTSI
jgi:hypothetical protein